MESESEVNATRGDDGAAAVRELKRLYELTEKLEAEAMRVLRGDAAALTTLPEVYRAITACLSVVRSPGDASALRAFAASLAVHGPNGEASPGDAAGSPLRQDNNTMRSRTTARAAQQRTEFTSAPHDDGYLWRKYGEKLIRGSHFTRSYFRCTHHRARGCQAKKNVQQQNNDLRPIYLVNYTNSHTCFVVEQQLFV